MEAVKTQSLGQISHALYDVGGEHRPNMQGACDDALMKTATTAIAQGVLDAPPLLTMELISAEMCRAEAIGGSLVPVTQITKYSNQSESPLLAISGYCLFELLDEFDEATGCARLAACSASAWYRLVLGDESAEADSKFLTWCCDRGVWSLMLVDQYLA